LVDLSVLFEPYQLGTASLRNRIAMAPMTRMKSPGGMPRDDVAAYYRRRAEGGCGLIISEGTTVAHDVASAYPNVPEFHGAALQGWKKVVDEVHAANGVFFPQLWHAGMARKAATAARPDIQSAGPSGLMLPGKKYSDPMSDTEIEFVVDAFAQAVVDAKAIGCDGVELHGAHGYLIDTFFWKGTNERVDKWGGSIKNRSRFAAEIVRRARVRVGDDYPIILRCSQWKGGAYDAKPYQTPDAFEAFLRPLIDAGVTAFHCSTRRFWQAEFDGSELNLAGWAKKLTGLPSISVGSVGLNAEYSSVDRTATAEFDLGTLERLVVAMERGDFDLIAIGRAFLPNPAWADLVREQRFDALKSYNKEVAEVLY